MEVLQIAVGIHPIQHTVVIRVLPSGFGQKALCFLHIQGEGGSQAVIVHPGAGIEGKIGRCREAEIGGGDEFVFVDQAADRLANLQGELGGVIVHIQAFQLVGAIGHGEGIGAGFMLSTGHGTGETGFNLGKLIAFHNGRGCVFKGEEDFLDLGLGFPPVCVRGKPHPFAGVELGDDIRAGTGGIVLRHQRCRNHRERHLIKQTVIGAAICGLYHNGVIILGGDGIHKTVQVLIEPVIRDVFILGFADDILRRSHHVPGRQGRSVRKTDILAEMEGPGFSGGGFLPAFSQAGLGKIIVIQLHQGFVDRVIGGDDIVLHRLKRPDHQRFGRLDRDGDAVADFSCLRRRQRQDQRQHQQKADQERSISPDKSHSLL